MDFKLTELATNPRMAGRREGGAGGLGWQGCGGGGWEGLGWGLGLGGGGGAAEGRGGEEDRTQSQQGSTQETPCSVTTAS